MAAPYHLRARHARIVRRRNHQSERDARTSAHHRSADAAVARYRDAFQADYDNRDPRLTDGIREMEAARADSAAFGVPWHGRKACVLGLDAMSAGIEGCLLQRAGGDEGTVDRLLDLSASLSSDMAAARRLQRRT